MTAKEYLSQAKYLDEQINNKIRQLSILNDMATKVTTKFLKLIDVHAGHIYVGTGLKPFPKVMRMIMIIPLFRDSYTVKSCLIMKDAIKKKVFLQNRLISVV